MMRKTPEFDSEHLTPAEKACERMLEQPNCYRCLWLQTHPKSGYRGCVTGNSPKAVLSGHKPCDDFNSKGGNSCESK